MVHTQKKRPFPKRVFEKLSKKECQNFIEALYYVTESETSVDVRNALSRFQDLFPFTRVIGGLVQLNPNGALEGFTNIISELSRRMASCLHAE